MTANDDPDATGPTLSADAGRSPSHATTASLTHYRVERTLGRGGMGEVVLADDLRIRRKVAIKRLHDAAATGDAIARFLREATIQARLEHPAIVPVHELGRDDAGQPYFTMKRLTGTTLAEVLARRERPLRELLRAFVDVCQAIDFAHAQGVVHRDLKPANIMLGEYGEVYVLDWGVARLLDDADGSDGALGDVTPGAPIPERTAAGMVIGTPLYMAPEQAIGHAALPPADVYALGAILFEILAGEPLRKRFGEAPDGSPARRVADRAIPPELDAVCAEAVVVDAAKRPTARMLADRVQRYLDGDRDLEQRRMLAAEHLARAQAAEQSGIAARRAEAMREAGQALALDPQSVGAAQLVGRFMLEPPRELPSELADELAASDREMVWQQAKLAGRTFSGFFLLVPMMALTGITDWWVVGALVGLVLFAVIGADQMVRREQTKMLGVVIANAAVVVLVSRLASPLVLAPAIAVGMTTSLVIYPAFRERPWPILAVFIAAFVTPLVLEATGVWAASWRITSSLEITSPALATNRMFAALIIVGYVLAIALPPIFVRSIAAAERAAQRKLSAQAWHLRQLVSSPPRGAK